jgi:hypothetical protein
MASPSYTLSALDTFGFHTSHTYPIATKAPIAPIAPKEPKFSNRKMCGGYVPLVGIVVGYLRLKKISKSPQYYTFSARIAYTVRAIFEMMGLGLLLLPLDVVATVVRMLDAYVIRPGAYGGAIVLD